MDIIGYLACVFIGICLGLLGAGGGILTVPVMVYLFHLPVLMATSYSLFIVGFASLLGASKKYKEGVVNFKIAGLFCVVSLTVVCVVKIFILPRIPDTLFKIGGVPVDISVVAMTLFSLLMLTSAYYMIRNKTAENTLTKNQFAIPRLFLCAALVGLLTGFLGSGGGFLLIPSLVILLGLPMKEAIGTSLFIIALNSLVGFTLDYQYFSFDWMLLGSVTLIAVCGIAIGLMIGSKLPAHVLRSVFGWFVLIMGIVILVAELLPLVIHICNGQPVH